MEETLEKLIKKVLFKKYPFLSGVKVKDLFDYLPPSDSLLGSSFVCKFTSDKCLSAEEQMEIDTDVKDLFKMLSYKNLNPFSFKRPSISCYFDCGKGFEFHSKQGYNH